MERSIVANRRDLLKLFGLASFATVAPAAVAAIAVATQRPTDDLTVTLTFRAAGPWGDGVGRPLRMAEIDYNFWMLARRLDQLEKPSWVR